tara:strand:- start:4254 stop:5528 length:1275 start_codon:yes stop_codon:yes gene_type:complete
MALKQLVEKRNELAAKQKKLADIYAEAKTDAAGNSNEMDIEKITSLKGTASEKLAELRRLGEELEGIGAEVDELATVETAEKNLAESNEVRGGEDDQKVGRFAGNQDRGPIEKGIGDLFVESDLYKNREKGQKLRGQVELKGAVYPLLKTVFQTSAGWAPESVRTGRVIEEALRPIQVIDTIPGGRTGQAAVVYMEETTVTSAAAERSENAAYAESTLALTEQSSTVRSIGTSIPVTDEQLEDELQVQSYLNMRLPFLVRQRLDGQILTGNGSAPNLRGINELSGIQTQAKGADPVPDAIYKAMTLVRVTGRAQPNVVYMHPNDWQTVRLLRTTDGIYIWGNPADAGPLRIWGVTVVETDAQTENTGLVGDALNFTQLFIRRDVLVEVGLVDDDFTDGRQTLRCGMRVAFVGYRPAAFCQVTGI